MKLTLGKREVNLILGIISLGVLVSYIFFFYMPKNEDYQKRLATSETLITQSNQITNLSADLQKLEENRTRYQEELDKIRPSFENPAPSIPQVEENVDHNSLIITLEEIADRNQIDMTMKTPFENGSTGSNGGNNSNPNGMIDQANQNLQNGGIANNIGTGDANQVANELGVQSNSLGEQVNNGNEVGGSSNPNTVPLQGNPNDPMNNMNGMNGMVGTPSTNDGTYQFNVLGEYRSIMIFLFELRNLEYQGSISNFELKYNTEESTKEGGFPLNATFNVKFSSNKGGVE